MQTLTYTLTISSTWIIPWSFISLMLSEFSLVPGLFHDNYPFAFSAFSNFRRSALIYLCFAYKLHDIINSCDYRSESTFRSSDMIWSDLSGFLNALHRLLDKWPTCELCGSCTLEDAVFLPTEIGTFLFQKDVFWSVMAPTKHPFAWGILSAKE